MQIALWDLPNKTGWITRGLEMVKITILCFSCRGVPGQDVHEGGGRADAERAEQELRIFRGVDP